MSVKKRVLQGIGANSFGQLINIVLQVVSVPLFIRYWGLTLYGEWLVLSTIPAYLAMSDLGFSSVAANKMAIVVGSAGKQEALQVFSSAWVFVSMVCVLVILFSFGSFWLPLESWLNITSFDNNELQIVIILLVLGVIVNLKVGVLAMGFRCDGHYALLVWITNFLRLFEFSGIIIGLYLGATPIIISGLILFIRCVGYFVTKQILKRKSPWIILHWENVRFSEIKEMASPAMAFMAFPLGNALKNQGMLTIIGLVLGPITVVAFNTMRTLINSAQQAMTLINHSVWPEMSLAFGANNIALARKIHCIACKCSLWLAVGILIALYIAGPWIFHKWTLGYVKFNSDFFSLMLLTMLISALWSTSSVVQLSTNTHKGLARMYLLLTVISVILSYIFTMALGIIGSALGLLILEIGMALYVLPNSLNQLKEKGQPFFRYLINPMSWR
jgi:O-antigen/teichoic acid export membrane protein